MTEPLWVSLREYLAAEIGLALARHDTVRHSDPTAQARIDKLEQASTLHESEVRKQCQQIEQRLQHLAQRPVMSDRY